MKPKERRTILSIDLKCFYASTECVDRGLDPFSTPLVVADRERGSGTIVLAISPFLKSLGWKNRQRVYDLPKLDGLIFARPRMARYIEMSAQVVSIFLDFVSEENIHVYSIDESFLDITHYIKKPKIKAYDYAKKIIDTVYEKTGLRVTCGIGENIFMAKAAMDIEAKKSPDYIAQWTYDDIPLKLWPVSPLSKMWGIGSRLEKRLNDLGFFTVGEIANSDKEFLKSKLGVIGEEIYQHANGIDEAEIGEVYVPESKSYSAGQVLFKDYTSLEGETIVKDMIEELMYRIRQERVLIGKVSLFIGYTKDTGGFAKTMKLQEYTDDIDLIKDAFVTLYNRNVRPDALIRRVNLAASDIVSAEYYQNDLFTDWEEVELRRKLSKVIDEIKDKYGKTAIIPLTGAKEESTIRTRDSLIGGHHK